MIGLFVLAATIAGTEQDTSLTAAAVKNAATAVRTVDPKDEEYSDLQALKKDLAGARVIVLAEQQYGEGSTAAAQTRLVKFLHKEMGFDVVMFESSMVGVREGMREVKEGKPLGKIIGPLGFRLLASDYDELVRYAGAQARTTKPLDLSGIDPWFDLTGRDSVAFGPFVTKFFDAAGASILSSALRRTLNPTALPPNSTGESDRDARAAARDEATLRSLLGLLEANRAALEKVHSRNEVEFLRIAMSNRVTYDPRRLDPSKTGVWVRDSLMAAAASFLINDYFKGRKVVVWGSNYHSIKSYAESAGVTGYKNMGDYLSQQVPDAVISIGFTAHEGQVGAPRSRAQPVAPSVKGSLEWAAQEAGPEFQWIDLKRLGGSYLTKLGPNGQKRDTWNRKFDFIFYMKTQKALTPRVGDVRVTTAP